jgi:radical SAM superfamily enzyme YgiQ (UPF0313 family)
LALASIGERQLEDIANVVTRSSLRPAHRAQADLNLAVTPDFDDWFRDVEQLDSADHVRIVTKSLPLEGSRGCWWGQTRHCTFCGIDEASLAYRSRSADDVLATLRELRSRYGDLEFRFSDYILARGHYQELLPKLEAEDPKFRLSCDGFCSGWFCRDATRD